MSALLKLIAALASILEAFVEAGGVAVLVDAWRSQRENNEEQRRLAYEQRIASALARGDLDELERHADRLLTAAQEANHRGRASDHSGGSGSRDGHGIDVAVGPDGADIETLQAEIDALID